MANNYFFSSGAEKTLERNRRVSLFQLNKFWSTPLWIASYKVESRGNLRSRWISWNAIGTSSNYNKYPISPSRHWTNLGYPQKHREQRSALFNLNKRAKLCILTQEAESLRCMVLIHLVKINTFKVKWNLSYLIIQYTQKYLGRWQPCWSQ